MKRAFDGLGRSWLAFLVAVALPLTVGIAVAVPAWAAEGDVELVSIGNDGTQSNGWSTEAAVSADGRYVVFQSFATNLVPGDTNDLPDVFVHDGQTGHVTRVGVGGREPDISADGRYVAFASASSLVSGDTNDSSDVFVYDRQTGETTRVSISSDGVQGNDLSFAPAISANGRYVAFTSIASNLVPGDANGLVDVFVHDRQTGETTIVSTSTGGTQTNDWSSQPAISSNGRYVAFGSNATNLVPGDTNDGPDVFVHDRQTGQTTRVSVRSDGTQATGGSSFAPAISADGRYVAFWSHTSNLTDDDTGVGGDIFVHDRESGETTLVSGPSNSQQGVADGPDFDLYTPAISDDGRYVAFMSEATNLVSDDANDLTPDVFVSDRQTGEITLAAVSNDGTQATSGSVEPAISGDGRYVAFTSTASNLVPGDTNGVPDVFVYQYLADPPPQDTDSFLDDDDSTFEDDIEWLAGEGITRGCNPPANDRFCPDDFVTRGQMAAFLVRALGYADDGGGNLFVDDDGDTFEGDIDRLGTAGVTRGCNPPVNDRFCPDDFVTRGQMAAFLVRALGYSDDGGGDLFVDDDGNTFESDIDRLGTAGVTRGCNPPVNDRFCPDDFVTRGQMAAFLHRALE